MHPVYGTKKTTNGYILVVLIADGNPSPAPLGIDRYGFREKELVIQLLDLAPVQSRTTPTRADARHCMKESPFGFR